MKPSPKFAQFDAINTYEVLSVVCINLFPEPNRKQKRLWRVTHRMACALGNVEAFLSLGHDNSVYTDTRYFRYSKQGTAFTL